MNVETDINLTKKKRIIFWVYLSTILAFFITITILSAYSYMPTKQFTATDNYYYASQVASDWQNGSSFPMQVLLVTFRSITEAIRPVLQTTRVSSISSGQEPPTVAIVVSTQI
jgi:hypothetical protein